MKSHIRIYRELAEHSRVRSFSDERHQILAVLKVATMDERLAWLTAGEISEILCEAEGINIPRQRVAAILGATDRQVVAKKRIKNRDRFRLMLGGEDELKRHQPSAGAHYVDPSRGFSVTREFEGTLATLDGTLKICDPHVENKTLDFLAACEKAKSIDLLTVNIHKESTFRRDLAAFRSEHSIPLSVKIAANPKLHDRYILHDDGMLLLGASLNGFGKKQSFVIAVGPDLRAVTESAFDAAWARGMTFA